MGLTNITELLNELGILSEWSVYSTSPINGLIGLKYIDKKCFTLCYPPKLLAISDHSIIPKLKNSLKIIHMEHYEMHPYGIHFKGKINGQESIIYFDTGKSHSAINQTQVPSDRIVSDKSGTFYNGLFKIEIGGGSFTIYYPRVKNTNRNVESDLPVGIEIGSEYLTELLKIYQIDKIIALGRKPESKIKDFGYDYVYVRHPANGGKNKFVSGIKAELK